MSKLPGLSFPKLYVRKVLKMKSAAVVACAGISSRMKDFKPLMRLDDKTVIENLITSLKDGGIDEIVVVVGYRADLVEEKLKGTGARCIRNRDYLNTKMFDSLKIGIRELKSEYDVLFLMPGDVPLISPETILAMQNMNSDIVRPAFGRKRGHPVMIKSHLTGDILAYDGANGLAGAISKLGGAKGSCIEVTDLPVDDRGVLMDADTPEDFAELRKEMIRRDKKGILWPEVRIDIARYDKVLTQELSQLLELIDQTGSIQSASACMHMSYTSAWRKLNKIEKDLGFPMIERYPGGTMGGGSHLTPEGKKLLSAYRRFHDAVSAFSEKEFRKIFADYLK